MLDLNGDVQQLINFLDASPSPWHAAQTAAVVGREFGYDVLEDVYDAPAELGGAVSTLQRRELVRERSRLPRRVYLFKHVLTQETAYSSLLLSKRRDLHVRVAECLERMEDESASEIARHFVEAKKEDRALPYLVEAGERAAEHTPIMDYLRLKRGLNRRQVEGGHGTRCTHLSL